MTKLTDVIKQALEKKQGKRQSDGSDTNVTTDKKAKKPVPVITGRPVKKASGRGR
jgi:hypothetical protein